MAKDKTNIVVIGMPGSGKRTAEGMPATRLVNSSLDTDTERLPGELSYRVKKS